MRRRDFIKGVAGSATAWPLATRAQQTGKLPTIGLLGPNALIWTPFTTAFVERLHQLGWVEDRTIAQLPLCPKETSVLRESGNGHWVACHLRGLT